MKTIEPFWWAFFGAGGVLSALFLPALIFINGLAVPLGWMEPTGYQELRAVVSFPIVRLLLFAIISLSMFHWAHRFRFTLYDGLQIKHLNELVATLCYGTAFVVTVVAGLTFWNF